MTVTALSPGDIKDKPKGAAVPNVAQGAKGKT
jgi:hypothetical protein